MSANSDFKLWLIVTPCVFQQGLHLCPSPVSMRLRPRRYRCLFFTFISRVFSIQFVLSTEFGGLGFFNSILFRVPNMGV